MKNKGFVVATISLLLLISATSFAAGPLIETPKVGLAKDLIYFVFPDRYLDGDPSNNYAPGFNPKDTAFFHGGDLKGLTGTCLPGDNGLPRIKKLGFTAVWLTPLVVQAKATPYSAGYHGYWGVDFLNVDPHLGTRADLLAFVACAKTLNLKIILDIVTNHTADIIKYNDRTAYIPEDSINLKNPSWLNDLSNYHNVGVMGNCWSEGPCIQFGDFFGLDDIATEKEVVYKGWADVYGQWIKDFGLSGFRVDTARHVDDQFFKNWSPLINTQAKKVGVNDFTVFGEVYDVNPINLMGFVRRNKIQTVLDFPFQRTATEFAAGYSDASVVEGLFGYDDLYTSATSDASNLVTFLGNHDMGRAGKLIESTRINSPSELLPRTLLAHALMYLSRGIPTVYYGDEVGMSGTGNGTDQLARQDMFSTKVTMWKTEPRIGSNPIASGNSFSVTDTHPIANYLKTLASLRAKNPALANAQMQVRVAKDSLFVISKKDGKENREYVVAFNNSTKAIKASLYTATSMGGWKTILGTSKAVVAKEKIAFTVPALSTVVLRANKKIDKSQVKVGKISSKLDFLSGYYETRATMTSRDLLKVSFYARSSVNPSWVLLGTDLNAPYSIFIDPLDFPSEDLELRASVTNSKGVMYELPHATVSITAP
ncbi:MAG: alpha-amylase family glycosyl hydrolase [Candidatus Planktophila sp.]|nr:alpha-amylase family glycosyl hydrolase [Candidatus Planktophila sp.]